MDFSCLNKVGWTKSILTQSIQRLIPNSIQFNASTVDTFSYHGQIDQHYAVTVDSIIEMFQIGLDSYIIYDQNERKIATSYLSVIDESGVRYYSWNDLRCRLELYFDSKIAFTSWLDNKKRLKWLRLIPFELKIGSYFSIT